MEVTSAIWKVVSDPLVEVKSGELDFIFTLPGNFEVAFGRINTGYILFRLAAY